MTPAFLNPAVSVCASTMQGSLTSSLCQSCPFFQNTYLPLSHLTWQLLLYLTSRLRPALACSGRYSLTSHLPPSSEVKCPLLSCLIREIPTLTSGPQRVSGAERTGSKGAHIQISTVCEYRQRELKAINQTLRQGRSYAPHSTRFQRQGCGTEAPSFLSVVHPEQATSMLAE